MPDHRLAEQFRQLCEQAAKETDPKKLLELTQAINRIFDEREKANRDLGRRALGYLISAGLWPSCLARAHLTLGSYAVVGEKSRLHSLTQIATCQSEVVRSPRFGN